MQELRRRQSDLGPVHLITDSSPINCMYAYNTKTSYGLRYETEDIIQPQVGGARMAIDEVWAEICNESFLLFSVYVVMCLV